MRVVDHFFGTPWDMRPGKLQDIAAFLQAREHGLTVHIDGGELSVEELDNRTIGNVRHLRIEQGIAIIPIEGVIEKKMNLFMRFSGGTSTELLQRDISAALASEEVRGILLDVDSPGGAVNGPQEISDLIYNARGSKPIWAIANDQMASAAYKIASAAERLIVTKTADVGSIGTYATVLDRTKANEEMGYLVHVIKAGEYKDATHPDTPLTDGGRQVLQEMVDSYYKLFVDTVARNRGFSQEKALEVATGREWVGQEAVDLGLADDVMTFNETLESLQREVTPKVKLFTVP